MNKKEFRANLYRTYVSSGMHDHVLIQKNIEIAESFVFDKHGITAFDLNKINIANDQIDLLLVHAAMLVDESGYYSFSELNNLMYLFPFTYNLKKELFAMDNRFVINTKKLNRFVNL